MFCNCIFYIFGHLSETLIDGPSEMLAYSLSMLWIGYVYITNLVYHFPFLFCIDLRWDQFPLLLPRCFLDHIFHDQHVALELSVSPTFPYGNFSLGSLVILDVCVFKLLFTVFLFSVILFLRLTHIDGERANSVTISVDGRSSLPVSSWTSTNTGPTVSALSNT